MIAARIPDATRYLGAPADWDPDKGECVHLAIRDVQADTGLSMMWSLWEPTPAELQQLNAGGKVLLSIVGGSHPPVAVLVWPAAEEAVEP